MEMIDVKTVMKQLESTENDMLIGQSLLSDILFTYQNTRICMKPKIDIVRGLSLGYARMYFKGCYC